MGETIKVNEGYFREVIFALDAFNYESIADKLNYLRTIRRNSEIPWVEALSNDFAGISMLTSMCIDCAGDKVSVERIPEIRSLLDDINARIELLKTRSSEITLENASSDAGVKGIFDTIAKFKDKLVQ